MTWKPSDAACRMLVAIDDAGSAVLQNMGSATRLLAAGEFLKFMPDTALRLLAFGLLESDSNGRLSPTAHGVIEAERFRSSRTGRKSSPMHEGMNDDD